MMHIQKKNPPQSRMSMFLFGFGLLTMAVEMSGFSFAASAALSQPLFSSSEQTIEAANSDDRRARVVRTNADAVTVARLLELQSHRKKQLTNSNSAIKELRNDRLPQQLRLGIGADWESERYVTWITFENYTSSPGIVEWRAVARKASVPESSKDTITRVIAATTTYDKGYCVFIDDCGWHGFIHTALLTGLPTTGMIELRVGSAELGFSNIVQFSTASNPRSKFPKNRTLTAAVFGDMGALPGGFDGARTTKHLIDHADDWDLIVDAGDIAYGYGFQFIWDEFGRQIAPLAEAGVPFQTAVGNHESPFNFSAYLHRYAGVPYRASGSDSMLWYSHDAANTHWVYFSTEHPYSVGSAQYNWLKRDLEKANLPENRKSRPWVFVVGHRPAYCSNTYVSCGKDSVGVRDRIEDLLHQNNVDVAFFGHVHAYERTFPVFNSKVAGTYEKPHATVYMLVGMAGAACCGDDWVDPQPDWSAFRYSEDWGYTRLEIEGDNNLCLQLHRDTDDTVVDKFCLTTNHSFTD